MKVLIAICIALSIFLPIEAQHLSNKYVAYVVSEAYNKQVACMAKNIYYEAAKEPHEGKLAVAQVTMNRANNKDYPSDFCGVVYQKTNGTCQFSWVCENKPEPNTKSLKSKPFPSKKSMILTRCVRL